MLGLGLHISKAIAKSKAYLLKVWSTHYKTWSNNTNIWS